MDLQNMLSSLAKAGVFFIIFYPRAKARGKSAGNQFLKRSCNGECAGLVTN